MRYEDASHTGAFQGSQPVANDDLDSLPAGSRSAATGNLITGEGTQTGSAGADSAAGAHVTAIAGKSGEDTSFSGGKLAVSGEHGKLSVDAEGNYIYQANAGVENVRDRFTYTLADNQGATDTASLIVEIGKTPVVIKANAQQIVPGPDGVVTLPPGVELSDVRVVGRNLVVDLPDGSQLIIIDGAIFVPQLVLNGVEIPSTNLAALLIGQEPQPAAGELPQSSGGNFAVPPPPLDPGVPLGDLIPPTELGFVVPEPEEVFENLDDEPANFAFDILIDDDTLPGGLAGGIGDGPDAVNISGFFGAFGSIGGDGPLTFSIALTGAPAGFAFVSGGPGVVLLQQNGVTVRTITFDAATGEYEVTQNAPILHPLGGEENNLVFVLTVTVTDQDGDTAQGTITITHNDDTADANNDTDALALGQASTDGNVITGVGTTSGAAGIDFFGADGASLTSVSGAGGSDSTFSGGFLVVNGQYGVLTIAANGSYTYVRNEGTPGGVTDVFTYTLTDGDGDPTTATLTITIPDALPNLPDPALIRLDDDVIPEAGGNPDGPGDDDPDVVGENSVNGQLAGTGGDGDLDYAFSGTNTLPAGFSVNVVNAGQIQILQGATVVMTITLNTETGAFTVVQNAPIDHPSLDGLAGDNTENNLDFSIGVQVVDADGDVEPAAITINVDDDTPVVLTQVQLGGTVDEDGVLEGADDGGDGDGNAGGVNDVPGENTVVQGNVSALFSAGADQPLTFSLLTDTSGLPALTSNGAPVTYSVVGNTLTASANGSPVFTLVLNGATGEYTFTLLDQLDHPSLDGEEGDDTENPPASDLSIALGSIIQATDADGDSVTAPANGLIITVDDDSPLPFEECPDEVITINDVGSTFTGDLNLPPVGADEPGVVSFVVENGDPVLDNEGNPITSAGVELFYFINAEGVLEARAGDATGEVIFTITLNGDGTFTYEQLGVIGEGGQFDFNDLTSANAGNVEFRGVGADDPATTVDLLLSSSAAGGADETVNTDSDSIGAANQSMDIGETVRIDLVSDLTTGAGTPSGFGYSGHVSSSSFIGLIPQVQGDQSQTVAFTVWALNSSNTQAAEPDRNPAGNFSDSTITAVTEVTVKDFLSGDSTTVDVTGFVVGVFTPVAYGISARVNADGSVTFSGIQQGDSYGFSTGAGEFNAVAVQAEAAGTGGSTQDSFDLGIFSIGVDSIFEPVDITVPIALTDSDGDAVVCDIDIHIGAPVVAPDITVTVNEAGLPLIGSDAASDSEIQSGDLQGQVTGGTGPYTFTLVGSGNGAFGTLVLNADGTFTYTLDTPFDSQPDADDGTNPELGAETFTFEATDSLGATQTGTITVNIIDDVPTAVDDTDSIAAGQFGPVTGNVTTDASAGDVGDSDDGEDTEGADGATVVGVVAGDTNADLDNPATVGVVIQGTYGKLTLNADGSYSYTRDAGTAGGVSDVFTYTMEDGDGDYANATLTITIPNALPLLGTPAIAQSDDEIFAGGNAGGTGDADPNTANLSGNLAGSGGDGPLVYAFTGINTLPAPFSVDPSSTATTLQIAQGAEGIVMTITLDPATGAYSVVQNFPMDHPTPSLTEEDVQFLIGVKVTDVDGDSAVNTLTINVDDDTPLANNDTDSISSGGTSASGNVITGVGTNEGAGNADSPGADGFSIVTALSGSGSSDTNSTGGYDVIGTHGTLAMEVDGSYVYTRNDGSPGNATDTFTYTYRDNDGDLASATLTINIGDAAPTLPDPALIRLDDDVIPAAGGNVDGPGDDDPDAVPGNVVNGNLAGSGGDGALTYNFTGVVTLPPVGGFTYNQVDADTAQVLQGATVVLTIQLNQATGAFSVTQNNPILHPADNGGPDDNIENNLNFSIGVEVEDADNDVEPATITINVDDDTPTIDVTKGDDTAVTLTTDDLQTIGGASDTAQSTANFSGVFGLTQSAGADGTAAAATLSYVLDVTGFTGGPAGVDSGLDQGGSTIFLYEIGGKVVGSTSATLAGVIAGNTVFDVGVDGSGVVTLTQYSQIDHIGGDPTPTGGPPFADHIVSLADGLVTLTASASLTDNDGDTVTDSEVANIGANLRFTDDGPDVNAALTGTQIRIDETDGVVAAGGEVDPVGGNLGTVTMTLASLVNVTNPHESADAPTTNSYALVLSGQGVASGLLLSSTNAPIFLYNMGGGVIAGSTSATLIGVNAGNTAFQFSINSGTGAVTLTQFFAVEHPTPGASHDEDSSGLAAGALSLVVTATDFDGDTDSSSVDLGSVVRFEDDGPSFGTVDALLEILNDATPTNTGDLQIIVGSDSPVASNDVISVANFTVMVNGVAIPGADVTFTPGIENATTASYTFSFDYPTGAGTEATATGTLVFDKAAGTYTVSLTNGPIQGFSILQTASGTLFQGYEFGTSNLDGSQPEISVTQIQGTPGDPDPSDLFVQFTSVSEPSSGTGDDNLELNTWVPGADNPPPVDSGGDTSWSAGQLFNQEDGWVSTSGSANGTDGDTIQGGEVLDFTLVQGANPTGILAQPETFGQATTMFLKFDGIGASEDMIVVLKLYDPVADVYTTRAVMIQNTDIQHGPGSGPGVFSGISLDNNDGLVIIEPNDYNGVGENWVIVGAQIAGSDEGVTGTAINLNGAIGAGGDSDADDNGSLDTQAFSTDTDDGPFKISSIGFITESTTDQEAVLDFDVTITDADGDTATQHLTVNIGDTQSPGALTMEALGSTKGSSSSLLASDDGGDQQLQKTAANSNTLTLAAAIAAAGLAETQAAAAPVNDDSNHRFADIGSDPEHHFSLARPVDDNVDASSSLLNAGHAAANDAAPAQSSSNSSAPAQSDHALDNSSANAAAQSSSVPAANDQGPASSSVEASPAAQAVGMPSAEALKAAGLTGNAQDGGSVDQIVAEALGQGNTSAAVDAILDALAGASGDPGAIANLASPAAAAVPAWDMAMHGAFGAGSDMMFNGQHAPLQHHDAIQPVVNG